jgi:hypothetical protein
MKTFSGITVPVDSKLRAGGAKPVCVVNTVSIVVA